jgi:hypothetical protein
MTIVEDAACWKARDWEGREDEVILQLTDEDVAALRAAVDKFLATGEPLSTLSRPEHFLLPPFLAEKLEGMKKELLRGRGFVLMRGFPCMEWGEKESLVAYMGVGVYIGRPMPQSKDGKLVNHVKMHYPKEGVEAAGHADKPLPVREHAHNQEFTVHTDAQADVLALLCIRQAKEGGISSFASTLAVHNEILKRGRKDLVEVMTGGGWFRDRTRYQDVPEDQSQKWEMPIFSYHDGYLVTHYNSSHYKLVEQKLGETLSPLQLEAMELFEKLGCDPEFNVSYRMQPGDALFLHNSSVLHGRSEFKDGDHPDERRHLVRLWLGVADDRPQPEHLNFPRRYSTVSYDPDVFEGLMRPDPKKFHVPLSEEADDI